MFKKLKSLFSFFASKSSIIFAEARALVQPREPCPALIKKLEKNHSLAELILECIIIAKLNPEKSAHEIIKEAKKKWYK